MPLAWGVVVLRSVASSSSVAPHLGSLGPGSVQRASFSLQPVRRLPRSMHPPAAPAHGFSSVSFVSKFPFLPKSLPRIFHSCGVHDREKWSRLVRSCPIQTWVNLLRMRGRVQSVSLAVTEISKYAKLETWHRGGVHASLALGTHNSREAHKHRHRLSCLRVRLEKLS